MLATSRQTAGSCAPAAGTIQRANSSACQREEYDRGVCLPAGVHLKNTGLIQDETLVPGSHFIFSCGPKMQLNVEGAPLVLLPWRLQHSGWPCDCLSPWDMHRHASVRGGCSIPVHSKHKHPHLWMPTCRPSAWNPAWPDCAKLCKSASHATASKPHHFCSPAHLAALQPSPPSRTSRTDGQFGWVTTSPPV